MSVKKGLGKGLGALIATLEPEGPNDTPIMYLLHGDVEPNREQPRSYFDDAKIAELAQSVRQHGILQPIIVREVAEHRYQIVAGERRWRAAAHVGLQFIPALVMTLGDCQVAEIALIENLQREDLSPLEEAHAFQRLTHDFGLTHEQLADRVGKSRSAITNTLRLLQLDPEIQALLSQGQLSGGHAKALLMISDTKVRLKIAKRAIEDGLSVRAVEAIARDLAKPKPIAPKSKTAGKEWRAIAQQLTSHLGSPVDIRQQEDGEGRITINFASAEQLNALLERLGIK